MSIINKLSNCTKKIVLALFMGIMLMTGSLGTAVAKTPTDGIVFTIYLLDAGGEVNGVTGGIVDESGTVVDAYSGNVLGQTNWVDPVIVDIVDPTVPVGIVGN